MGSEGDENNSEPIVLVNVLIEYTLFSTQARGIQSLITLWWYNIVIITFRPLVQFINNAVSVQLASK